MFDLPMQVFLIKGKHGIHKHDIETLEGEVQEQNRWKNDLMNTFYR